VVIGRKVHKCQDKEGGGRDGVEPAGQHTNDEVAEAAHHDSSGRSPVYQSGVSSSTEPAFVVFEDQCGADATTGQAISAFVILRGEFSAEPALEIDLRDHVAKLISPIAKPAEVVMLPELPKTRSGKIMRRLLKDLAEGTELGDVTTLADVSIVETITKEIADRR
jgi:acyl-CoA synthetase (AMP-forming)/AMP-acid ligase II